MTGENPDSVYYEALTSFALAVLNQVGGESAGALHLLDGAAGMADQMPDGDERDGLLKLIAQRRAVIVRKGASLEAAFMSDFEQWATAPGWSA